MKRINFDFAGPYGTFWGTVCVTLGVYATASVAYTLGLAPWWALVAGVVGGWAAVVADALRNQPLPARVYRVSCMLGAGVWGCWALASSPWTAPAAAALAIGALAAGLMVTVYTHEQQPDQPTGTAVPPADAVAKATAGPELNRQGREWELRLARICRIGRIENGALVGGAQVQGIERWKGGAGHTVDVDLPPGKTWRDVAGHAEALASDLRLPTGCGVEVVSGVHRGACLIRVSERDNLAEDQPYPTDYSRQSINGPIGVGVFRDGSLAEIEMRQPSTMVLGQKRSGKTNQLQVLIGELGRCVDCLVWCVDMGGGGVALPWLWPWREGRVRRPVVDWVAAEPTEARLLLEAALRIARHRKTAYAARKRAANTDLLPIDATVPEIVIVVDEGAEVTSWQSGLGDLASMLTSIVRIAGDSAVNVIYSGLRADGGTVGRDMSTQMGNRLVLRMQDHTEYGVALDYAGRVSPEDVAHQGCGFLATIEHHVPRPYRAYRMPPRQIEELSLAVDGHRPTLDGPSAEAAGAPYASRWERAAALVDGMPSDASEPQPAPDERKEKPVESNEEQSPADPQELLRRVAEAERRLRAEVAQDRGETYDPEVDERFKEIVANTAVPSDPSTWPDPATAGRARMVELVDLAGAAGIMFADLQERLRTEGISPSRSTLYNWLAVEKAAGSIVQPAGDKSPYIAARFNRQSEERG